MAKTAIKKKAKKAKKVAAPPHVYAILDRSGSMNSIWVEALGSINGYVADLAENRLTKHAPVTLAVFDTINRFEIIRRAVKASEWKDVTREEVTPRAGTPLFDAVGSLVSLAEGDNPKKGVVLIETDGWENSSKEYNQATATAALDRLKKKDWQVVFLGANFDATAQAAQLNVAARATISVRPQNLRGLAGMTASKTLDYAFGASGQSVSSYSDQERTQLGENLLKNRNAA